MVRRIPDSSPSLATPAAVASSGILPGTIWGDLVETIDGLKKQGNTVLSVTVNRPLGHLRNQLNDLSEEQTKALQDAVNASNSLSNWSFGAFTSSVLYATSSIMGGYYLKLNGQPEGDQFMRSGALLLANAVLTHLNGWSKLSRILSLGNQTVEQILTTVLPIAVTLFTYLWNARNLTQLPKDHKEKIENVEKLFKIVNCAILAGQTYMKFQQGQADRQLQYLDAEMSSKNLRVNQLLSHREWIQKSFDSIGKDLRRFVKNMFYTTADFAKN